MSYVSIIIPNYNHASFLSQRIESILNQSYQHFEIIILDDFSRDNSREIIESYRDSNKISSIIYNDQNSGSTFKQWEKGISAAKGDYIWIAESDDYASADFLEKAMLMFTKYPEVGIVKLASVWVDHNNAVIQEENLPFSEVYPVNGKVYLLNNMSYKNSLYNASAIVFKKLLAINVIDEEIKKMRYCGDWLFWNRLLLKTSVATLPEKCNYFRKHTGNVSGKAETEGLFYVEGISSYIELRKALPERFKRLSSADSIWAKQLADTKISKRALKKVLSQTLIRAPFILPLFIYYKFRNFFN